MLIIGLDVGDRHTQVCVLDAEGEVLEESRIPTTPRAVRQRFSGCARSRVVLEVGTHSPWIESIIQEGAHEVLLANPRRVRLIAQSDSKSDRADAEVLARLGRADPRLLAPITSRRTEARVDLALIHARDTLVRARTGMVNHVRGALKPLGVRAPACSPRCLPQRLSPTLPQELRAALLPLLEMIQALTLRIRAMDKEVERIADERYPITRLLRQVNGVGALTALCFVATIDAPERFKSSRTLGAYFGLRPRRRDSGDQQPQLRITKSGDPLVRRLLVGSAQHILGPFGRDSDLRRWGLALTNRGGMNAKKRAVVAVARKLSVLLHRLWVSGEVYQALRNHERGPQPATTLA